MPPTAQIHPPSFTPALINHTINNRYVTQVYIRQRTRLVNGSRRQRRFHLVIEDIGVQWNVVHVIPVRRWTVTPRQTPAHTHTCYHSSPSKVTKVSLHQHLTLVHSVRVLIQPLHFLFSSPFPFHHLRIVVEFAALLEMIGQQSVAVLRRYVIVLDVVVVVVSERLNITEWNRHFTVGERFRWKTEYVGIVRVDLVHRGHHAQIEAVRVVDVFLILVTVADENVLRWIGFPLVEWAIELRFVEWLEEFAPAGHFFRVVVRKQGLDVDIRVFRG